MRWNSIKLFKLGFVFQSACVSIIAKYNQYIKESVLRGNRRYYVTKKGPHSTKGVMK